MSNIEELKQLSEKLTALLTEPELGCTMWHEAVHEKIDQIAAFHM